MRYLIPLLLIMASLWLLYQDSSGKKKRHPLATLSGFAPLLAAMASLFLLYLGQPLLAFFSALSLFPLLNQANKKRYSLRTKTRFVFLWQKTENETLQGKIVAGIHAGKQLETLNFTQLITLLFEYQRVDPVSANALGYYLDQRFAATWRQRARAWQATHVRQGMDSAEAYRILGLAPGAAKGEIKKAYRKLMHKAHPDLGGSTEQATLLNQAKAVLLR